MKLNRRQLRRLIEAAILERELPDTLASRETGREYDDPTQPVDSYSDLDPYGNKGTHIGALENKEGAILNAVNAELKRAKLFDEKNNVFANPAPGGVRSVNLQDEYIPADIQVGPIEGGDQEARNEKVYKIMDALGSDVVMNRMKQHKDVIQNKVQHVFSKRNFQISSEMGGSVYSPSVIISFNI